MKWITMLTDVRDGSGYYKGELRYVAPEVAGYFIGNGWAKYPDADAIPVNLDPVVLKVQHGSHGHAGKTA